MILSILSLKSDLSKQFPQNVLPRVARVFHRHNGPQFCRLGHLEQSIRLFGLNCTISMYFETSFKLSSGEFTKIFKSSGHLKFNRHFLKAIFDLLTLNRFPNGFCIVLVVGQKNHEFFPAPTH